jgi:ribosome-associated translation inhibitor RaiA
MDSMQDPSAAADQARQRLHEEIERVRAGVEEMLTEQGVDDAALRRELDAIRDEINREIRSYVKRRIGKLEKRVDKRVTKLERRIDQVEQDRQHAEWRIHTNNEAMLDGLLKEVRAIADLLTRTR